MVYVDDIFLMSVDDEMIHKEKEEFGVDLKWKT